MVMFYTSSSKNYDNESIVLEMFQTQKDMKLPIELFPYCPACHKPMTMNSRIDVHLWKMEVA